MVTNFNPRSPQGERREIYAQGTAADDISIHAPRRGSDMADKTGFNPAAFISIHAPRRGSDCGYESAPLPPRHFNPRSPQGERLNGTIPYPDVPVDFNPRSPQGERLADVCKYRPIIIISIHAPRRGSDGKYA